MAFECIPTLSSAKFARQGCGSTNGGRRRNAGETVSLTPVFFSSAADLTASRPARLPRRPLADQRAFEATLAPLCRSAWVVFAKRPFAGPRAVLAYLARYTDRVAISNSRLIALDEAGVTFQWKDYRVKGRDRLRTMTLDAAEFIRRFLLHVLPSGFHRIRHYGLSPEPFERATSSEPANFLLRPRSRPKARTPRPTARPKHLCLRADARVAAAREPSAILTRCRASCVTLRTRISAWSTTC